MRAMITGVLLSMLTAATSCSDTTPTTAPAPTAGAPAAAANANAAAAPLDAPRVPVEGLPSLGNANAKITVVAFVDYECPFSARANDTFTQLRAKYGDDLRLVLANRPLPIHTHARDAALAALAAAEQGRFAEMHARLYEATPKGDEGLVAAARAAGLDMPRWEAARHGESTHAALMRVEETAQALGVTGTPTSFVDGRRIEGAQPMTTFTTAVDADLVKANGLLAAGETREGLYARLVKDAPTAPAEVEAPCHAKDDSQEARDEVNLVHTDGAPVRGQGDAKVAVVVFTDFQCPFCARLEGRLRELQTMYPEKVKVIYKARPLPMHSNARLAARAAFAAQKQGKFWALYDAMFAHQTALDRAGLESYAAAAGLDMNLFRADLDEPATSARVSSDGQDAEALAVTGTPTLFVNGRRLVGARPMTELVGAVERALAEAR
jgi:protein-disulfide isomerase